MSTFLWSFGVVAATIAAVLYVVLTGPDQPATVSRQPSRANPRRRQRPPAPSRNDHSDGEVASSAAPVSRPSMALASSSGLALPDSDIMRLRVLPATKTTFWVRLRSGVVLVVLVAILGALLALAIGGALLGLTLLLRGATG